MPDKISIEQFPDQRFSAHGQYEIWKEDGIYMISVEGPFNLESVIAMGKARRAALTAWGTEDSLGWMVVFTKSMLMSLDALEAYSAGLERELQARTPVRALAWVVAPDVEGTCFMLEHFARIFSRLEVPWQVFEDPSSAKGWIQERIQARA